MKNLLLLLIIFVNASYVRGSDGAIVRDSNGAIIAIDHKALSEELYGGLLRMCRPDTSRSKDADFFYKSILKQRKSDSIELNGQWNFFGMSMLNSILNDNKSVDSVEAIATATLATARYYGFKITPYGARLMGNNKEHWLVYSFPTIQNDTQRQETCYRNWVRYYETGRLTCKLIVRLKHCPKIVTVLISREKGQVLAIEQN